MLKIRTKGHRSKLTRLDSSKGSFYTPPTAQLFDCKTPQEIPLARGAIIDPSKKRKQITTRRGPITIPMPKETKREKYKLVPRDQFLPERQVSYSTPLYPHRTSEEERELARQADIAANGLLVQISNKTLDSIYDKFDLFTIGDDILKKIRTGQMSKKEARASAMLAFTRELKTALAQGEKKDVDKLVKQINGADKKLLPTVQTIGSTPEEVASSSVLDVALLNSVAPFYDPAIFVTLTEMIQDGKIKVNPDTDYIDNTIPFEVLANTSLSELEKAFALTENDEAMRADRILYKKVLDHHKGISAPITQSMDDEEKHSTSLLGPASGKPVGLQAPLQDPADILRDMPSGPPAAFPAEFGEPRIPAESKTRQDRTTEFYADQSTKEDEFIEQITTYINELVKDIEKIVAGIDVATSSTEANNKLLAATARQKEIQKKISGMVVQLKQDKTTLPDVQGEINTLLSELGGMVQTLADDMGEEQKRSVDIVPPPPPEGFQELESFKKKTGLSLMEQLRTGLTLRKTPKTEKPLSMAEQLAAQRKKGLKKTDKSHLEKKIVKKEDTSLIGQMMGKATGLQARLRAKTLELEQESKEKEQKDEAREKEQDTKDLSMKIQVAQKELKKLDSSKKAISIAKLIEDKDTTKLAILNKALTEEIALTKQTMAPKLEGEIRKLRNELKQLKPDLKPSRKDPTKMAKELDIDGLKTYRSSIKNQIATAKRAAN